MRVLLDNCVDIRFKPLVADHEVVHVVDIGWASLANGTLLSSAEARGFEVFVTVDKNIRHQQNFAKRSLSLVVLNSLFVSLDEIAPLAPKLQALLDSGIDPGNIIIIEP